MNLIGTNNIVLEEGFHMLFFLSSGKDKLGSKLMNVNRRLRQHKLDHTTAIFVVSEFRSANPRAETARLSLHMVR